MTKLRCADVEARLVDSFDGRLSPAETVRVHAHIEGCDRCRERAALWRTLVPAFRAATPADPSAMAVRRMQIEIEHQLTAKPATVPPRRWRPWWAPAMGLVGATAFALSWWALTPKALLETGLREATHAHTVDVDVDAQPSEETQLAPSYAALASQRGPVTVRERSLRAGARIPSNAPIVLGEAAAAELALDRGATLRITGPARVQLEGGARDVAVRVSLGRVDAEVTHRAPDERFAVVTNDALVVVRGTKFSVFASSAGSRVEVSEGRVTVERPRHETQLVSAGETFDTTALGLGDSRSPAHDSVDCAEAIRACRTSTLTVRASMRAGDAERALHIIAEARRALGGSDDRCDDRARACDDELRYLHAEALNQAGHLDDAVAAYRALDRKGAPSAMRQNALYAAAQIERGRGRLIAARSDFERALAAAPHGALYEEALAGAMESAQGAGDGRRARHLATRYLAEFPQGLVAATARRLVTGGMAAP